MELDLWVDIRELLPKITAPTLVIGLTRDQVVPVERARTLHEHITGSRYAEIDSGHLVAFERAEELTGILHGFLLGDEPAEPSPTLDAGGA